MKNNSLLWGRLVVLTAIFSVFSSPLFAQKEAAKTPAMTISVSADHPDALYEVGETATFTVDVKKDGKPLQEGEVVCVLSKDGFQPQAPQKIAVKDGKATISGKLDEAGFLLARFTTGNVTSFAGAGFSPLKIQPSMPAPDDFDQFWNEQKAALAAVPLKSTVTAVKSPVEKVDAFDVQIDCVGKPVSGYFGKPQGAKPKSLPAILFVHGAGVRSSSLGNVRWATEAGGMLALDINAHGIPNGKPADYYKDLSEGELKDYRAIGRTNRDECYFKGMYLRLMRAIDFLAAQPEWDGKTLVVYGSSQGGLQALAATGLDSRVTLICAGVPAGCDHTGSVANRISGWPKFSPIGADGKQDPKSLETSRYFDCVNFAKRAKCKEAAVTVGFIDTVCPPTSVYAAYNALGMQKSIFNDIQAGHTNTPPALKFMKEAVLKHVQEMK
ncbi:acetylxylan esterase [Planctomicrobium sp. SH527]|uniref:acetylxylan esterase n=1 Tax=Planctomicrobium sp. SH527 TaxID=3448123 RepID=UPI003F5B5CC8